MNKALILKNVTCFSIWLLKSAQYDFRSGQEKGKESFGRDGEKGGKRLRLGGGSRV